MKLSGIISMDFDVID